MPCERALVRDAGAGGTPRLADALEQLAGRGELQAAGEDHDCLEARRALAALQQADLGAMQVAEIRQGLLR